MFCAAFTVSCVSFDDVTTLSWALCGMPLFTQVVHAKYVASVRLEPLSFCHRCLAMGSAVIALLRDFRYLQQESGISKLHEVNMQNGSLHQMALALYREKHVIFEKVHALGFGHPRIFLSLQMHYVICSLCSPCPPA